MCKFFFYAVARINRFCVNTHYWIILLNRFILCKFYHDIFIAKWKENSQFNSRLQMLEKNLFFFSILNVMRCVQQRLCRWWFRILVVRCILLCFRVCFWWLKFSLNSAFFARFRQFFFFQVFANSKKPANKQWTTEWNMYGLDLVSGSTRTTLEKD